MNALLNTPPAPDITAGPNPLQAPPAVGAGAQAPVPSHEQTVAALRHFMAIVGKLKEITKDPSLGKSDCKGKIIDGMTSLVAERMIAPATAVMQLSNIPSNPLDQRKWVNQMLQQTIAAQNNVLDHHVAGNPATLDWGQESQHQPGPVDDHMDTMKSLMGQYSSGG